jgi:hypothetical protein
MRNYEKKLSGGGVFIGGRGYKKEELVTFQSTSS